MSIRIRQIALSAVLVAFSLSLFAIEILLPPFPFAPSAKIGLANIVTLFMLTNKDIFKLQDCFLVLVARCVLASFITGRLLSIAFSLAGGILALTVMFFSLKFFKERYTIVVSVTGAIVHNLAQIFVGTCIYGTFSALYYIPVLFLAGIVSGVLTGICVYLVNKNKFIKKIIK